MNTEQLAVSRRNSLRARAASGGEISRSPTISTLERRPRRAATRTNRAIDLAGAILLAVTLAIPMVLIAVLIKLTSRGPALYWQERTGLHGRPFVMYKFRTMRVDAEERSGPVWAKRGDPRRTWIGVLLRRSSLDELPQLINVLKGEMSLVGPRPERPFFVQSFSQQMPEYDRRHQVLPGITGWAQINGWRGDSSIEKRLECDLYYVQNWSVLLNLRILLLTPFKVLVERNAC
jgi:exopolysaccharide biosynthesis polyprenyl glycosylphosphotransferase